MGHAAGGGDDAALRGATRKQLLTAQPGRCLPWLFTHKIGFIYMTIFHLELMKCLYLNPWVYKSAIECMDITARDLYSNMLVYYFELRSWFSHLIDTGTFVM